jgi:single-stranded-DNA-specific exonuclease
VRWTHKATSRALVSELSRELGTSPVAASLFCRMGLSDALSARRFMNPRLQELDDPFLITHMAEAVERMLVAIKSGETIAIFGDYDVDGVTSTVLLIDFLKRFGVKPTYIVPRRMEEGYGLSRTALERMLDGGRPKLLLAVDCGTNSIDEVRWLKDNGTDVIILDHHTSRDQLTTANDAILVNPHVFDGEEQPWSHLCTVGLAFKFVHALLKKMRAEGDESAEKTDIREYLDLVAMGTVADLVPLTEENRILACKGIERLKNTTRTGIEALFEVTGIERGQTITPFDIAFKLSPRINASGRLADAGTAVEMLLCRDRDKCHAVAQTLDNMNRERQDIERAIAQEAMKTVDERYAQSPALVLHSSEWHQGVVGIVASRLANHYRRPAIVLGTEEGGLLKGSGRSVEGADMVQILAPCTKYLETWGGHPMAVGISIKQENLDAFRKAFETSVAALTGSAPVEPELDVSCWIDPDELTEDLFKEIDAIGPYGQGNPQPTIAVRNTKVPYPATIFGGGHCRFLIEVAPGRRMACVAWRTGLRTPPPNTPLDIAARLTWNVWKGQRTPQLQVEDWREHVPGDTTDSEPELSLSASRRISR